ncbi:MAG: hypothetical protein ACO3HJ_00030 [Methylophilaceae bacterium]
MQVNANYVVCEEESNSIVNFYSTQIPQSLAWAKDCARHMKSLSGKSYEVFVKVEGQDYLIDVKDYENSLG